MNIDILDLPGFYEKDGLVLRQLEGDQVPIAVFEHSVPRGRDARVILERGYGLHLVDIPRDALDLLFLERFDDRLEHLGIADFNCTDTRRTLALKGLKTLSLHVNQQHPMDMTVLPRLESYDGFLLHFERVLRSPSIRRLSLQGVGRGRLDRLPPSLEWLMLVDAGRLRELPDPPKTAELRELHIHSVVEFDLHSLIGYPLLEVVGLGKARSLTSADALLQLPRLRGLALDGCPQIEPIESLLKLDTVTVSVLGRNPFNAAFRVQAEQSAATWTYYGTARRPAR